MSRWRKFWWRVAAFERRQQMLEAKMTPEQRFWLMHQHWLHMSGMS